MGISTWVEAPVLTMSSPGKPRNPGRLDTQADDEQSSHTEPTRNLGLGTHSDDEQSWHTELYRYLGWAYIP